jgi:magnesium transporter
MQEQLPETQATTGLPPLEPAAGPPVEPLPELTRDRLRSLVSGPQGDLAAALVQVHPADIAACLLDLSSDEAWQVFEGLDTERRAEVLAHADEALRERILERLTPRQLTEVVQEMPGDEAVDLLALADDQVAEQVLQSVDLDRAQDLRELAAHPEYSAGGVMTVELVTVPSGARIGDAIKLIKLEGEEALEGRGVYVVDGEGRPIGYLSDRELLARSIHEQVDVVMAHAPSVRVEQDQEEAASLASHYGLREVAVVDARGVLVGTIPAADLLEVLEDEATEDFNRLVGTSGEEQTRLPIAQRVLVRLPLMGVTVAGGLLTAWILDRVLSGTGETANQSMDLLRFVPIVIGLAGNVGVQSSTILVRAFATGEVEPDREFSVLRAEVLVGLSIGMICGSATALAIGLLESESHGGLFGLAVGAAIAIAVTWAALLGCVVPMTCRRIRIDPAIVAGPFLIAVSDVSGTALYLGVASLLLVLA